MSLLHYRILAVLVIAGAWASPSLPAIEPAAVGERLRAMPAGHPRLFLAPGGEASFNARLAADPVARQIQDGIVAEAERMLTTRPVEHVLTGKRLLAKSRTCLSRVLHLGLAWRLTGRPAYLERARAELVAVARFPDWNPSHFLDVAELTMAVGIGYDWFYSALDEPTRALLRDAIVQKGLQASLTADSWTRTNNNWNQVCNAGMTVGALAIAESEPALAARMITRALETLPLVMHEYAPDGAYPEGPSYWGYGTTFNVILISALQSALGTDFGLSAQPGFMATADYYLHVIGPTGSSFNYSDADRGGHGIAPAMFWFAAQRRQSHLLWNEWPKLAGAGARSPRRSGGIDPFLLLWLAPQQAPPAAPPTLSWTGGGTNPVAFHRSGWTAAATFVALKGGTPSAPHAHMDVGSFVMDADGVRWAEDLGRQDYNSLESKGIDLWGKGQDAGRWAVFRLGTSSHNVLQVDGQQQRVAGHAPFVLAQDGRTVVDTSSIYAGQLARAQRGVALLPDRSVLVQDEFTAPARKVAVRWAMATRADVTIDGPGRATLTLEGKTLDFRVLEPAGAALAIYPTDPPPAPTDARNEGTRMIGFEVNTPPQEARRVVVQLVPGSATASPAAIKPLAGWRPESFLGNLAPIARSIQQERGFPMDYAHRGALPLAEWRSRARAEVQKRLSYSPATVPLDLKVHSRVHREGYEIRVISFAGSPHYRIPAYLLVPDGRGPFPGVVALHDHGGWFYHGKEKLVRMDGEHAALQPFRDEYYGGRAYAEELARRGFVVIVADAFYWGERRLQYETPPADLQKLLEGLDPASADYVKAMNRYLVEAVPTLQMWLSFSGTLWGGIVHHDDRRTVDVLASLPEVDAKRLGCLGLSGGGFRSTYLAGMDPRIKASVITGWMTSLPSTLDLPQRIHAYMFDPFGVHAELDHPDIASLGAPDCAIFVQQCARDWLFTRAGMDAAIEKIRAVYADLKQPARFQSRYYDVPHSFGVPMQEDAFAWLERWLKK